MKKKIYPLLAILLSAAGIGLQCWAQTTGFEPLTGLLAEGAVSMPAIKVFFVVVPVLALLCSLPLRGTEKQIDATGRLYEHLSFPGRFCGVLAGMMFCGGALLRLTGEVRALGGLAAIAVDALLLAAGVGMVWQIVASKPSRSLFALLPGFATAFWLVLYYHTQSRDPIVERYGALLLGLMAMALAFYHQAGYSFGNANPVRSMTFTLTAGVYLFAALPAAKSVSDALLITAAGIWMVLHTALLPEAPEKQQAVIQE